MIGKVSSNLGFGNVYLGGRSKPKQRKEAEKLVTLFYNDPYFSIKEFMNTYKGIKEEVESKYPEEDIGVTVDAVPCKYRNTNKFFNKLTITIKSLRTIDRPGLDLFKPGEKIASNDCNMETDYSFSIANETFASEIIEKIDAKKAEKEQNESSQQEREAKIKEILDMLA